ncbi:hypothetical protein Dimus_016069, partial [Dionaea muscipula]
MISLLENERIDSFNLRKSLALKADQISDDEEVDDDDMTMMINEFQKTLKKMRINRSSQLRKEESSSSSYG